MNHLREKPFKLKIGLNTFGIESNFLSSFSEFHIVLQTGVESCQYVVDI